MKRSSFSNDIDNKNEYKISLFGEFADNSMESEYLAHSISGYCRTTALVALTIGIIFLSFLGCDYFDLDNPSSFFIIAVIRVLYFIVSMSVFFVTKKITKYTDLIYLITAYEGIAVFAFLLILEQYDYLSYLSFFSLMVITLAIYVLPNKIVISQIISAILSILFFLFPAQMIIGFGKYDLYKIIAYQIILLIYCNINAHLSNSYKRKQFEAGREIMALTIIDTLTGIYNRAKFDKDLNWWVDYSGEYDKPLSLIFFDIDDFKRVNDSYGHLTGDNVINNIVDIIKKTIRKTDIFARWGGEEFVILLPDTDIRQTAEIAERMRICIRNNIYNKAKNITCSFGIATLEKGDTAFSLLRKADILLLQAKNGGKDRVVSF